MTKRTSPISFFVVPPFKVLSTRAGFGKALLELGKINEVIALCADLTESTQMHHFAKAYPDRFFEVGVAEQNLVTLASGFAKLGFIPFVSSYAAFSPGRNWEQIRTTICLNNVPVKIIGSHAGLSVGPDGATHQMLEDIALMRSLPNMFVFAPGDANEAENLIKTIAHIKRPCYVRLSREDSPIFLPKNKFKIGKATKLHEGDALSIFSTGTLTWQAQIAAQILKHDFNISVEVLHFPTIKPLDTEAILESATKTNLVLTIEEHQIAGGFGSAVCEYLSENCPVKVKRLGVRDQFGQSGRPEELRSLHHLDYAHIVTEVLNLL